MGHDSQLGRGGKCPLGAVVGSRSRLQYTPGSVDSWLAPGGVLLIELNWSKTRPRHSRPCPPLDIHAQDHESDPMTAPPKPNSRVDSHPNGRLSVGRATLGLPARSQANPAVVAIVREGDSRPAAREQCGSCSRCSRSVRGCPPLSGCPRSTTKCSTNDQATR